MSAMVPGQLNPVKSNNSTMVRKSNQNIQVYLRVRPTNERERLIRSMEMVEVPSPREVVIKQTFESKMSKKFTFDRAFGPESKQADVYQAVVAPLIEEVLAGYNCTVFAYGQTGTGKTHTMVGDEIPTMVSSWEDDSQLGIIPRSLSHLFQELRLMGVEFSMRVSYLELYNEELCDLLSPSETTQIRIFDDANKKGSIIVQGLEEIPVHTTGDVYKLLAKGQEKRRMASTLMNAQSSRSHTIFSITVHIRENGMDGEELLKIGKLNLVDLAGSENLSKAGNEKGIRTRETVNINQSLLTLGRVITALVERTPHIPYRESKLTRLLQESLGGRTKTSIIATVSPGHKDLEETLSTLEYAHRAKNIQNRPEVNQKLTKKTVLKEYTEEIDRLKRDLMASRDKNGIYLAEETYQEMTFRLDSQNKDLNEKVMLIKALKEEMVNKQRIFTEVSMNLVEKAAELESTQGRLQETAEQLDQTKSALRTTNRRYQEKKHLVENHMQTEQLLTGQATALIGVVDEASTDTYRLQDTIDRRRSVDAAIRQATEQHARGMDENLQQFGALLEQTVAQCRKQSSSQTDEFALSGEKSRKFTEETLQRLRELAAGKQARGEKVVESMQARLATMRSDCEEVKKARAAGQTELHGEVQAHLNYSDEKLIEVDAAVEEQRRAYAEYKAKTEEMHLSASTAAATFLTDRRTTDATLLPLVRALVERHQHSNTALRTEIAANEARMRDMHTQMLRMFDEIQQSNRSHTAQVDQNATAVAELLALITEHTATGEQHLDAHAASSATDAASLTAVLQHWSAATVADADAQRERIASQRAANQRQRGHLDTRHSSTLAALETEHSRTAARIAELQLEIEQLQAADCTEVRSATERLATGVQSDAQRQRNANSVCASLSEAIQRDLAEYGQRVQTHVGACRARIEAFHRQELKTYSSTGETPAKREFVFSRQLAQTSPHERIVRRFWSAHDGSLQDMDCSVTICEGNESAFLDGITDERSSSILLAAQRGGGGGGMGDGAPALVLHPVAEQDTSSDRSDEQLVQPISVDDDDDDDEDLGVQVLRPNVRTRERSLTPTFGGSAGGAQLKRTSSKSPGRRLNRSDETPSKMKLTGRQTTMFNRSAENKENVS